MRICLSLVLMLWAAASLLAETDPRFSAEDIVAKQRLIDAKGANWMAGHTTVSDLSLQEFRNLLGYAPPKGYEELAARLPKYTATARLDLPVSFDWRDSGIMTPVKNQGNCGSCWDFAANGAFEAAVKHRYGTEYDLSEQAGLSCNIGGASCNGGWAEAVYEVYTRYGAIQEACMPYQASDAVPCTQGSCEVVARAKSCLRIADDVNSIKEAVLNGPVSTHFRVYQDFRDYYSGCYQHTYGDYIAGHVVVITGWDDTLCGGEGAWLCKNSWGPGWAGLGGYFWIKWGDCNIGIGTTAQPLVADPVDLVYESHRIVDNSGDNDGVADIGESFLVAVTIRNKELDTASSVQATLRTTTPGAEITDSTAEFSDIPFDYTRESLTPHFAVSLDPALERGSRLDFTMSISCTQGQFLCQFHDYAGHLDTVFADNMEAGAGAWTHAGTLDDWQNGVPTGVGKSDPPTAHSGSRIWGNNLNGDYQALATNYLESPHIDCSDLTKAKLRFYRWMAVEKGVYDSARVLVNGNLLWINDSLFDAVDTRWIYQDIDISSYADNNPAVTIRFALRSDDGLQMGGWHIDDVAVVGIRQYLRGDANGDHAFNISDAVYLVAYIFAGGSMPQPLLAGDASCDGTVNISDAVYLIAYIFAAGPEPGSECR